MHDKKDHTNQRSNQHRGAVMTRTSHQAYRTRTATQALRACRPRTRCGSWSTFERRFKPIDSPDQTVWWAREQLPKDVDERLVWTITDCDGKLYVAPGYRFVNRIDYVLCEIPWTDEDFTQPDYRYD
jgi:hypothetical protein